MAVCLLEIEMVGQIAALITAIGALIGAVWGIVKYYDVKRTKEQETQVTFMKEMREENQNQSARISELITKTAGLQEDIANVQEDLNGVHAQLHNQEQCMRDNEMHRLQTAIIDFASALRNGVHKTLNDFNAIFHAYDRYKEHGGNSFVDSEMIYIRHKKEETTFIVDDENTNN